jgi:putative ABC transport system substrate-binding protein
VAWERDSVVTRRRFVLGLGAGALAPVLALSQPESSRRVYRIGLLHSESESLVAARLEALREGLRDFGYVEGKNIAIDFRWAEGKEERLPALASELVRLKVDVIVTTATEPVLAAKRATASIPIVFATVGDAVATGVVASLARPGGNATGSTFFSPELMAKRLELAKGVVPKIARVGVLLNPDTPLNGPIMEAMNATATSLGVMVLKFDARDPRDLDVAFGAMVQQRVDAVIMHDHPRFIANRRTIADLAVRQRLPAVGYGEFVEAGGLIGYGVNFSELWRRAAYFVDKIFKGAKPTDLPIEQATKFDLTINTKTAKQLGVAIPSSILVRADKVIE